MKVTSNISAFAAYQNAKLKSQNKVTKPKQKRKKAVKTKSNNKKLAEKLKAVAAAGDVSNLKEFDVSVKSKEELLQKNVDDIKNVEMVNGNEEIVKKRAKKNGKKERGGDKKVKKSKSNKVSHSATIEMTPNISSESAKQLFQWLLAPLTEHEFYVKYWEQRPLHIKRSQSRNYYKHIFSSTDLDRMLRDNALFYTKNIDVVSYSQGVRETHNPEGRAVPSAVWDYYSNECSVRVLNPQCYNDRVHLLLATLQEYFGNTMGANVYLTPAGSQGFAPHWDDIEAFVLQLEGRKHWKLYGPKNDAQVLARHSSHNLSRDELGPLKYSATVEAGDLLYFPRGTIHEACTDNDSHSLHITVSVYQNNCYADLLENILPVALQKAAQADVEFRKGLPLQYLNHVGVAIKPNLAYKKRLLSTVKNLMTKMLDHIDVEAAADQLGRKFMYDSLPPVLTPRENLHSVKQDGEYLKDGRVCNRVEFAPNTKVRLLRQFCLRVVVDDDDDGKEMVKIYYNTENSRLYHGEDEQYLVIDGGVVAAITHLIDSFPAFVEIEDLPIDEDDVKLQIVSDLWEHGLLVTEERLDIVDE